MLEVLTVPFPNTVSLSLSSVCCAKCIFCPLGRGLVKPKENKFMTLSVVDKIVSDCQDKIMECIIIGDNGEALLHPDFKEITRRLRAGLPKCSFGLASNFYLMDEDMSKFVLDNYTQVSMNLDGFSEKTYSAVKGLPFHRVYENLTRFVSLRQSLGKSCKVNVNILTQPRYYAEIGEPERITVPDETLATYRGLNGILRLPYVDGIFSPFVMTWAERKKWNRPRVGGPCIGMGSVGWKMFIDTNGDVYPCCQDYDSEIVFGNVLKNSVGEIWLGEKRTRFVSNIVSSRFADIGDPCAHCQD